MFTDRWNFDNWAKSYDETIAKASQAGDWMYKDYDLILDKVVEYCELTDHKQPIILDIGVGIGALASRFLKMGLCVIGVDPSKEMRKICKYKFPEVKVLAGNFLNIPLPAGSIDIIVSTYAFHHLMTAEKEKAILEMEKVLKTYGRIIIADLMFKNAFSEKKIKQSLRESGKSTMVEDIEDEYYGLFDDLSKLFRREGFSFEGEQITTFVWIFRACLED